MLRINIFLFYFQFEQSTESWGSMVLSSSENCLTLYLICQFWAFPIQWQRKIWCHKYGQIGIQYNYPIEYKTLWEKKKLLVTSNFFFSHNVFNSFSLLRRHNDCLWSKGLNIMANNMLRNHSACYLLARFVLCYRFVLNVINTVTWVILLSFVMFRNESRVASAFDR